MKKFSEYVDMVSEALVTNSQKEGQAKEATKFQSLLEKYQVETFAALNEEDQTKFVEELKVQN